MKGFGVGFKSVYKNGYGSHRVGAKYSEPRERVDWNKLVEFEGQYSLEVPSPLGIKMVYFDKCRLPEWKSANSIRIFDSNSDKRRKGHDRPEKLYVQLIWASGGKITRLVYGHRLALDAGNLGPGWHVHHLDEGPIQAISTLDCRACVLKLETREDHARITAAHNRKVKDDQKRLAESSTC